MQKLSVGDLVCSSLGVEGLVTLVCPHSKKALIKRESGRGHDGVTSWSRKLGWVADTTLSCWFVNLDRCTLVKRANKFKGNAK